MDRTWLSVIIPSHNGQRWLAAAFQSIVDQKEPAIEVVFIDSSDDGDTSLAIADSFSDRLNVQIFRRSNLLSWMAKTNFGVEQASGDMICMLHQDDLWLPNRCGELRKWLVKQPDGAIYVHPCYIINDAGKKLGLWRCPLPTGDAPVPTQLWYERLLVQNFIGIPTPTIRRDAYLEVCGLDETLWYTADWDLYLKLAAAGNVYYHADPLACFRVHKHSLTVTGSRDPIDFRNQHQIVIDRHADKLEPETRSESLRLINASVEVNVALAAAATRRYANLVRAVWVILALGPRRIIRYLFCSRLVDRLVTRLRALIAGGLQGDQSGKACG